MLYNCNFLNRTVAQGNSIKNKLVIYLLLWLNVYYVKNSMIMNKIMTKDPFFSKTIENSLIYCMVWW